MFYTACRAHYARVNARPNAAPSPLDDFSLSVFHPGTTNPYFSGGAEWDKQVRRLAQEAAARFSDSSALFAAFSDDPVIRLSQPHQIPGCSELVGRIGAQLERTLYQSFLSVDKVHIFRHVPGRPYDPTSARGSWVWHIDGHPKEIVKVLVYLTDVTNSSSAFEYVRSRETGRVLRAPAQALGPDTWQPHWNRVGQPVKEAALAARWRAGFQPEKVFGPPGTTVMFNTNVVHRGVPHGTCPRDTLIVRFRPSMDRDDYEFGTESSQAAQFPKLPSAVTSSHTP